MKEAIAPADQGTSSARRMLSARVPGTHARIGAGAIVRST